MFICARLTLFGTVLAGLTGFAYSAASQNAPLPNLDGTLTYLKQKIEAACDAPCGIDLDVNGAIHHFYRDRFQGWHVDNEYAFNIRDIGDIDWCAGDCIVLRCNNGLRCVDETANYSSATVHTGGVDGDVTYPARTRHHKVDQVEISIAASDEYRGGIYNAMIHYKTLIGGTNESADPFAPPH
jgi:hypothetical protein